MSILGGKFGFTKFIVYISFLEITDFMVRNRDQELSCSKSLRVVLWAFCSLMKLTHRNSTLPPTIMEVENGFAWKCPLHPQKINISPEKRPC